MNKFLSYAQFFVGLNIKLKRMKKIFVGAITIFALSCNNNTETRIQSDSTANIPTADTTVVTNKKENNEAEIMAKTQVPVLCYHRIENGRKDEYTVSPAAFEAQMKILADSGYTSVSPDQLHDYLLYNAALPEKPVMITFDDSRVEHYTIAAPVMEKYGHRGAFFIMTITYNKKNYMTKEQIAELAQRGHTVGLHTWDHHMVTKYNDSDWVKQIVDPQKYLAEITGKPVNHFAYPFGINDHTSAVELDKYFKLSFILSTKRDSTMPLQMVRRMIVPYGWTPQGMLKAMHSTFKS